MNNTLKRTWLMGGFGNVLFQIIAYRIIKKTNPDVKCSDILTKRNIITKILGWTIHERLFDDFIDSKDIKNVSIVSSLLLIVIAFTTKLFNFKNNYALFYNIKSKFNKPYPCNIFGYFQEKEFLENNQKEIIKLGQEINKKYKMNKSLIVVHYRWGDSDWAKVHSEYYSKVKKLIRKESEIVYIATDSPEKALEYFSDCKNIKLTDAKNALDDFKYMVNAKKLYCAPSTFSWWAAHSVKKNTVVLYSEFLSRKLGIYTENYIVI